MDNVPKRTHPRRAFYNEVATTWVSLVGCNASTLDAVLQTEGAILTLLCQKQHAVHSPISRTCYQL